LTGFEGELEGLRTKFQQGIALADRLSLFHINVFNDPFHLARHPAAAPRLNCANKRHRLGNRFLHDGRYLDYHRLIRLGSGGQPPTEGDE
jgi:hypothetical protein